MGISDKFNELKDQAMGKAEELKGQVKGKAAEAEGNAKGKAAELKGEAKGKAAENEKSDMIDKGSDFINEKTGGKYESQINSAEEKIRDMTGQRKNE